MSGDRSGEYFQCGKVCCTGGSEMLLCFLATVPYDVDAAVIVFGMIEGVGASCLQTMRGFIWQEGRYPHEVSFRPSGPRTDVEGVLAYTFMAGQDSQQSNGAGLTVEAESWDPSRCDALMPSLPSTMAGYPRVQRQCGANSRSVETMTCRGVLTWFRRVKKQER